MSRRTLCTFFLLGFFNYIAIVDFIEASETNRPIIGVLAQEISLPTNRIYSGAYKSYIAASYIKFVEGGGARAVPVWIGKPKAYYEVMLKKLNGMVLPGGGASFKPRRGYAEAGAHIYKIAQKMNDDGIHFPIIGICLGFELLLHASNNNTECRTKCSSQKASLPLNFTKDFRRSRLYGLAPQLIVDTLRDKPVTPNFHSFCITYQNLTTHGLNKYWKVLSYSYDINGLKFISSIEHRRYPFYGLQFHPEKVLYEWIRDRNIAHSKNAARCSQYFAVFFVGESRRNANQFTGIDEENRMLIYNFPVTFTALLKSAFSQSYLFKNDVDYVGRRRRHRVHQI